ncbi:MAG: 4-amino-4-deoxy-L-arabinose transferase-like glycosyltransferase [Sulfitobacter sp.]|jgi:4-amino-4-deoxy-L-arabinose transferase-like glycosyltransferase
MSALHEDDWQRRAAILMALGMAFKIAVAWSFPLGVDEAYAIGAAREFSWSFFDHPPVGFWLPVVSASLFGESALIYRLPFLLCGLGTGVLLYMIGARLGGARAGFWTLALFMAAPHMLLGSGAFVVPDGPLNLGGALVAYAAVRMADAERPSLALWALGGLGLMLAMGSKYQAGLIPFGVLSFMFFTRGRWRWILQPGFWLVVAMGLVGVASVIIWNLANDWASFSFHGSRTARELQLGNFAAMLAGQLVYLLPATLILALIALRRGVTGARDIRVLAHLALWPIVIFNAIYLFSDASFPHWTMPGFVFALPLAGLAVSQGLGRAWRWASLGFGGVIWALLLVLVVHIPTGLLGPREGFADWDRTEEVFDWSGLAPALRAIGAYDGSQIILVDSWIEAGQMSTGLAMGQGFAPVMRVLGLPHHFGLMSEADATGEAIYLMPERADRLVPNAALERMREIDPEARDLGRIVLNRGGRPYAGVVIVGMMLR